MNKSVATREDIHKQYYDLCSLSGDKWAVDKKNDTVIVLSGFSTTFLSSHDYQNIWQC